MHLDQPEIAKIFKKGESIGSVESVKVASEIYTPVSGEVTEVICRGTLRSNKLILVTACLFPPLHCPVLIISPLLILINRISPFQC